MSATCAAEFCQTNGRRCFKPIGVSRRSGLASLTLMMLACALASSAQRIDAPPRLEPTAKALTILQTCGQSVERRAPQASQQLLAATQLLTRGLLIGWNNPSGEFAAVPPPKEYVEALQQEAKWCQEAAQILSTDPAQKQAAERALEGIANDLRIKVEDCREWGMGRLITVIASTLKNGQPDPGWTVMYKWVSVSGLNTAELSFPKESSPTAKSLPPGIYSIYATKQVGDTLKKTEAKNISAFQKDKVQCEIPVP